jgi:hypothetical protein
MLALKKENARLKRQLEDSEAAVAAATPPPPELLARAGGGADGLFSFVRPSSARPGSAAAGGGSGGGDGSGGGGEGTGGGESAGAQPRVRELLARQAEAEARYREMTAKLKRLLEVERRNVRAVRAAHAKDLQTRTELEGLLRACSDDVRREIALHRATGKGARPGSSQGREVAVAAMSAADRERVLELLLSQERVVKLLYDKAFLHPVIGSVPAAGGAEEKGAGGGGESDRGVLPTGTDGGVNAVSQP